MDDGCIDRSFPTFTSSEKCSKKNDFFENMSTNINTFFLRYVEGNGLFLAKFYFLLGLMLQGGYERWVNIRIFGVLQRLALCYFFAAIIVLIFDDKEDEPYSPQWAIV